MATNWTLFVDESGPFTGRTGDTSVVAGLLLPGAPDDDRWSEISQRLKNVASPGAWPPHTADRNQLAWQLALALNRAPNHPQRERADKILNTLHQRWVSKLHELAAQVPSSTKPCWNGLGALRTSPGPGGFSGIVSTDGQKQLSGWVNGYHRSVRRIARKTIQCGEQGWALSATACSPDPLLPIAPACPTSWAAAFQALLHRVHLVLAGVPEATDLHLMVADLALPATEGGVVHLAGTTLTGLYSQAVASSKVAARRPLRAHAPTHPTPYFDPEVHPGLVLADWWANRAERLTRRGRAWRDLRTQALAGFGLKPTDLRRPIAVTAGWPDQEERGPTLTATGTSLFDIASALGQAVAPPARHPSPAWLIDNHWVGLVRGLK